MNNSWLILLVGCFLSANGKLRNTFIIIGSTTVYKYFFEEAFTVADFTDSGW